MLPAEKMENPIQATRATRAVAGFSLIEVLCVMALIGAITSWIAYNQTGLGNFLTRLTPEEVFRRAAEEARYQAHLRNETVLLKWDTAEQRFQFSVGGQPLDIDPKTFGEDQLFIPSTLKIVFAPTKPVEGEPRSQSPGQWSGGTPRPLALNFLPTGVNPSGLVRFQYEDQEDRQLSLDLFSTGSNPALLEE